MNTKKKEKQDHGRWPGQWRVICDVCGFEFYSGEVRKRWDNMIVCEKDYETKHPALSFRVNSRDRPPPFVRSEPVDVFVEPPYISTEGLPK